MRPYEPIAYTRHGAKPAVRWISRIAGSRLDTQPTHGAHIIAFKFRTFSLASNNGMLIASYQARKVFGLNYFKYKGGETRMKKTLIFVLAAIMVVAFAGVAFAKVSGSKHDLSSADIAGTGSNQVCVFCHHPHRGAGGSSTVSNALLWNVDDFSRSTYSTYTNNSLNAVDNGTALTSTNSPQSFLCMACHDGVISANALVLPPGDGTNNTVMNLAGGAALGTTLADDHPVNFTYTTDGGLATPAAGVVTGASTNTYPLFAGLMQCGTCHDVHAGGTDSKSTAVDFMRGDIDFSEICTDCHTNK